jgi:hypothetical protein
MTLPPKFQEKWKCDTRTPHPTETKAQLLLVYVRLLDTEKNRQDDNERRDFARDSREQRQS